MRKNLLSKFVLLITVLLMGATGAWAEKETINLYEQGYSNGESVSSTQGTVAVLTFEKGSASTAPAYYKTGTGVRVYAGGKMSVSAKNNTITKVVVTFAKNNSPTISFTSNGTNTKSSTESPATWEGSATEVYFNVATSGHARIQSVEVTYTASVSPSAVNPELTVTELEAMKAGMEKPITDYYTTNSDGAVSFESDDASVANVVEGVLIAYKAGVATITVSVAATEAFNSASKEMIVSVTENQAVDPEGPISGGLYELVTDATTLAAGDKLIIASGTNGTLAAMSTTQEDTYRAVTSATAKNGVISEIGNDVQVITLEGEAGAWYLKVGNDKYLYAASSGSNHIKTAKKEIAGDNGKAEITIKGTASITFQGNNSRNNIRYNSNGQGRFSCYDASNTTLDLPYIFRFVESTAESFDVTIGATGWKTFVPASNVQVPNTVKAYTVAVSDGKAELTSVEEVPAGAAVLLNGEAGDHTMTILKSEVAALAGNALQVSDAETGNGVYVLANKANGVGFYKWTGGLLGAGRVYLDVPASSRSFISWGEATGISNLTEQKTAETFYDLQGRRVAHPQKGLYIMDGRKVVVK